MGFRTCMPLQCSVKQCEYIRQNINASSAKDEIGDRCSIVNNDFPITADTRTLLFCVYGTSETISDLGTYVNIARCFSFNADVHISIHGMEIRTMQKTSHSKHTP